MNVRALISVLISLFVAGMACNTPPSPNVITSTINSPTPEGTVGSSVPSPTVDIAEFATRLEVALMDKDFNQIRNFMGDAFLVRYIDGASGTIAIDDAVTLMQQNLLISEHPLTFDETISADALVGDSWQGVDPPVVKAELSRGWGESGADQAIILISVKANGSAIFSGLIYARGGFGLAATATANVTVAYTFSPSPSGTVDTLPTANPAPRGPALYETDFKTGWTLFNETNVKSQHMQDGYQIDVQGTWAGWSFTTKVNKTDFYAEITARPLQCPENQGNYGLIFHYRDDNHFRLFLIWCNGRYTLTERTEEIRARLLTEGHLLDQMDPKTGDHRIGVLSQENNITLYIDDIQLTRVGVGDSVSGDLGPYVETTGSPVVSVVFTHMFVYSSR